MSKIIVFGNEKGGAGKTTTAMHTIIFLAKLGYKVASFDIDLRQSSLTRYIENRAKFLSIEGLDLEMPVHELIKISGSLEDEKKMLDDKINDRLQKYDFIVIDTPGSDHFLSRFVHSKADILVTPINDSFIDVDLIGKVMPGDQNPRPGVYSEMLWQQKLEKAQTTRSEVEWYVVRNRISSTETINSRKIEETLKLLSKKFGFKIAPGFSDRVIFKELFVYGLTLLDVKQTSKIRMSPSLIAARAELKRFLDFLDIYE